MAIGSVTPTPYTRPPGATGAAPAGQARAQARDQGTQRLTEAELRRVSELKAIDAKVRAHEAAHMAAGFGIVTGGPSYSTVYGPDGRAYAVGGEVGVDTSTEKDPQANIDKGRRIQAAAMAPAEPSGQDFRVAAQGRALEAQGRQALAREQSEAAAALLEARQAERGNPWRAPQAPAVTSDIPRLSVWA
ncbi:putative metalloprotease CJM1_0395 family protein [Hydrogenophaga sp. OTU3427]|uniref:putative metalloprotease CJM1_0395 family protein n=1 Tax=Hydrogenophaga sp. OTU3427 TaxID=3043856 RepID=UPI00313F2E95